MEIRFAPLGLEQRSPCVWRGSPFNWLNQRFQMKAASDRPLSLEHNLSTPEERLGLALVAGRMGTWELGLAERTPLLLSGELRTILGLEEQQGHGIEAFLARVHRADRYGVIRKISQAIRQGMDPELEFRFEAPQRGIGWLLCRARLYRDEEGRPVRLVGVGIDITSQKSAELEVLRLNSELEQRVAERTKQLEATNRELEAFCYSVSHDLRAPLRSIRGFNEVLLERHASELDEKGQEFLRRACQASRYMDELIESLLKLSRVGRTEMLQQKVGLSELARSVAAELAAADASREVVYSIEPGLRAMGDERLLRIVLDNLLRNAWKFTSKTPRPRIEVGFNQEPDAAFFVRDNGAGFDPSYAGRLFGVFQRLHSNADFPGTGVGLATVQRIINRHGGRVWATGAVNQGATFYFSLPTV